MIVVLCFEAILGIAFTGGTLFAFAPPPEGQRDCDTCEPAAVASYTQTYAEEWEHRSHDTVGGMGVMILVPITCN